LFIFGAKGEPGRRLLTAFSYTNSRILKGENGQILFDKAFLKPYHNPVSVDSQTRVKSGAQKNFLTPYEEKGMFCPSCGEAVTEENRFCTHCGSLLTPTGMKEKTVLEDLEATALEPSEDLCETTVMISTCSPSPEPEKPEKIKKPLFFAWLVSLEGPDKGKDHRLLKERISIGKQESSDIVIKRDFISRSHALLLYENRQFILSDLHSTNHTYVNGEMISKKTLKDNDVIKFGEAVYKFKCL